MATTITERTLNTTEAYEWLDQHWAGMTNGDTENAVRGETPESLLDGLNSCYDEPLPITLGQFERWLDDRGYMTVTAFTID